MRKMFWIIYYHQGSTSGNISWNNSLDEAQLLIRVCKNLLKAYCRSRTLLYSTGFQVFRVGNIATFKICASFLEKISQVYIESQSQS